MPTVHARAGQQHSVEEPGEAVSQELGATYFDTDDLRLAAAGLTLRRRTGGDDTGWRLTVPGGAGAPSARLPSEGADRTVPEQLQRLVRTHTDGAPLRPVAEVTTVRTVRRQVDASGHVLSESGDDRVMARTMLPTDGEDAGGAAAPWREVEVEPVDGERDLLEAVDSRLRAGGAGETRGAAALALLLGGDEGARRSGRRPELTRRSAAGDVVLAHLREQVAQVRAQDVPVRLDAPDSIHKMRVATRRLRSALTTFKPLFDAEVAKPVRDELKWLAGELGAARDAEVMRDRVRRSVELQGEDAVPATAAATASAELDRTYRDAHDRVLAELDGERYQALLRALHALVSAPPLTESAARRAGKAVPELVARSYRQVRRIVSDADARPEGAEREELLHDARKAAKAARYAGESVSRVFGADATAFAQAMEAVQEALGEHQDSVLTRERLRDLALRTPSTGAAFLYGRLHALEEARAQQSHGHFRAAWKAAGRKSLHRWLR